MIRVVRNDPTQRIGRIHAPVVVSDREMVPRLPRKIMPQEKTSSRMLHTSRHLHHILHDLLNRRIRDTHIDRANGDHKIKTRDDVSSVLDEFVEISEVVLPGSMRIIKIVRDMAEGVEYRHIYFEVVSTAPRPEMVLGTAYTIHSRL